MAGSLMRTRIGRLWPSRMPSPEDFYAREPFGRPRRIHRAGNGRHGAPLRHQRHRLFPLGVGIPETEAFVLPQPCSRGRHDEPLSNFEEDRSEAESANGQQGG